MKVHWLTRPWWGKPNAPLRPACSTYHRDALETSEDPADVTCKACLRAVDQDLKSPEDIATERAEAKARGVARGRAAADIARAYPDEYQAAYASHLEAATAELYEQELSALRIRQAWDEERRQKRRAELEAELEALQ